MQIFSQEVFNKFWESLLLDGHIWSNERMAVGVKHEKYEQKIKYF